MYVSLSSWIKQCFSGTSVKGKTYNLLVLLKLEAVKVAVARTRGTRSDLLGPRSLCPVTRDILLLNGGLEDLLTCVARNLEDQGGQGQATEGVGTARDAGRGTLNESLETQWCTMADRSG